MGGKRNPPLIYGEVLNPEARRTLLIYGHYDVQPPEPLEAWISPPFEPTIRDGRIFGRGSADNKGQLFAHLKAIEAVRRVHGSVPVNVKFLLDPEEEVGSPSLMDFCRSTEEHSSSYIQEAEDCFLEAIKVAQRQNAKSWELKATLSLARLWQQRGKSEGARAMLAAIYDWFTEGFDQPDLIEARALLEAL